MAHFPGHFGGGILGFFYDSVNKFKQKVGKVQATDVEPRKTELLHGDAFIATKDKYTDFVDILKQGVYKDPFIATYDGLLRTKCLLFLRVDLLQGIDVGTLIVYERLLILLKESCYKGRVRGCVSCVATSWDPRGLCSALQGLEE